MKIGPALLLLFLTSTASAQVDDRLFADYVRSLVRCCFGKSVVVFYTGRNRSSSASTSKDSSPTWP